MLGILALERTGRRFTTNSYSRLARPQVKNPSQKRKKKAKKNWNLGAGVAKEVTSTLREQFTVCLITTVGKGIVMASFIST